MRTKLTVARCFGRLCYLANVTSSKLQRETSITREDNHPQITSFFSKPELKPVSESWWKLYKYIRRALDS